MKVHLVCYEDVNGWILGKIATKLCENLNSLNVVCDISKTPDLTADINHHIIYWDYNGRKSTVDTVMITHINTEEALAKVKHQLNQAPMGICFSAETVEKLSRLGIPRSRLCYILPAHDEVMRPRPTVIGLTSKIHNDGRKREWMLVELAAKLNPAEFSFKIMGMGWENIVQQLRSSGFEVEYHNAFDYELNQRLVPSFDYYLYFGVDEGAMGFIDALAAGVPTIVTPQGYHLDAENGITHPFMTLEDLTDIFERIAAPKRALLQSVKHWTWRDYAAKHIEVWDAVLRGAQVGYQRPESIYRDGLSSVSQDFAEQLPGSSDLSEEALTQLLDRVTVSLETGDLGAAEALLHQSLTLFPLFWGNYLALSEIYSIQGKQQQAQEILAAGRAAGAVPT